MPPIERYMTSQPWVIAPGNSLAEAHGLMREHGIRHLPVVDRGTLVGIVSEGDLRLVESFGVMRGARVHEAMTEPAYTVRGHTPVDEVVRVFSDRKYGSVVVVSEDGAVEGIFTVVDACRVLADVLERTVA